MTNDDFKVSEQLTSDIRNSKSSYNLKKRKEMQPLIQSYHTYNMINHGLLKVAGSSPAGSKNIFFMFRSSHHQ